MNRRFALAALTLVLAVAFDPTIANAALHGGFPGGAHLYGFGPPAAHNHTKGEPVKAPPKLAGPLDFLNVYAGVTTQALEYPFLNAPRCAGQNAANRLCATEAAPAIGVSVTGPTSVLR